MTADFFSGINGWEINTMTGNSFTYRSKIKRLAVLLLTASLILSVCSCSSAGSTDGSTLSESEREERIASKSNNLIIHKYIVELLGFNISDECIDGAEAIEGVSSKEEYPKIKMVVKADKADEVRSMLNSKFGAGQRLSPAQIPGYQNHQFANELKQMREITYWVNFKTGKDAKSIDVNIYMAKFYTNTFLYIM